MVKNMPKEKCLVVGLGNIGLGFDFDLDNTNFMLTHCAAIKEHDGFVLSGGVDPSSACRSNFEKKYMLPAFSNIDDALNSLNPTVGVICNPTEDHYSVLVRLLESPDLKVILCEKPLSYDFSEAQKMVEICEKKGVSIYVNYMRRADPNVIEIKRRIDCGEIAGPIKISAWYSKGILNNGSHLINLVSYWLGEYISHNVLSCERSWNGADPEPDVFIQFERGNLVLMSAWEEFYTHLTAEVISPSGRLYYSNGGENIAFSQVTKDSLFDGYDVLVDEPEIFKNYFLKYQYHVYQQLSAALNKQESYLSDGFDGLRTLGILEKICGEL